MADSNTSNTQAGATAEKSALELRGRQLGAQCLRDIRDVWASIPLNGIPDEQISETILSHEPDVLRRYLQEAKAAGQECERGLLCVLSEFIGCEMHDYPDVSLDRRYGPPCSPSDRGVH